MRQFYALRMETKKRDKMRTKSKYFMTLVIVLSLVVFSKNAMGSERKYGNVEKNPESSGKKIRISLKFSGNYGYLFNGAGDLNKNREGLEAAMSDMGKSELYSSTFDWKRLSMLPDWKVDLIINITPKIGIGIGSGFITASNKGKYSLSRSYSLSWEDWTDTGEGKLNVDEDYKITAIPLNLDVYFFQPIGKSDKFTFFGHAGFGYYFGKLTHVRKEDGSDKDEEFFDNELMHKVESDYNNTRNEEMKCNSLGFHGGLGLEMKISSVISLGAALFGTYVNFKDWEGDASSSWKSTGKYGDPSGGWHEWSRSGEDEDEYGQLWSHYYRSEDQNKDYVTMMFEKEKPTRFKNVRKSSINLNRVGLSFSVKFYF